MGKLTKFLLSLALVLSLNGCSDWDDFVDSISGSDDDETPVASQAVVAPEEEAEAPAAAPIGDPTASSSYFDHYNPYAFDNHAVAMVFCWGDRSFDSCEINGIPMVFHGLDKDRDVWALWGETGLAGEMVCQRGDEIISFAVTNTGGMQYGSCQ